MKFLDINGLNKLWNKILNTFQKKETGKGLSENNFSKYYKEKLDSLEYNTLYKSVLTDLVKEIPDLLRKEVIYEYKGSEHANFNTSINVGVNFSNYDYIEIFCKTDDGYELYQKVEEPNGKDVTFSAANIGGGQYFFMKCKTFTISGTTISTTVFDGKICAGLWYYQGNNQLGKLQETSIGIARIVGYKKLV